MSRNNNTILAAAVIGALYASGAAAQFNISTATTPLGYAQELTKPVTIAEVAGNRLAFNLGYNFSDNEVRFARVQCSSNLTFITPEVEPVAGNAAVVGGVNNTGNAVFFSITDPVGGGSTAVANTTIVLGSTGANIYTISNNDPVTCTYSLYDQPSQAQAGLEAGRIVTISRTFINAVPSFTFTTTQGTATADVEAANGAYTGFLGSDRSIGSFNFALVATPPLNAAGLPISLADIFGANTAVRVNGDMTAFTSASGHAALDDCAGQVAFSTFSAANGVATAVVGNTAISRFFCFTANGTLAIPAASYTATLVPVVNPGFTVGAQSALPVGEIVRNGTQLQAPLVQTPNGFISRIALTNTGSLARNFTWTFRPASGTGSEASTTYTGQTSGTGSIPANGSLVISLVDALGTAATTFGGTPPRGTFTVNVAGPNNQIQGLYQIVNPASGSISNHVMVRPGTN